MNLLESDAPMIVYIDIKSPYAFVAIQPTLSLERELGQQFEWLPIYSTSRAIWGLREKRKDRWLNRQAVAQERMRFATLTVMLVVMPRRRDLC